MGRLLISSILAFGVSIFALGANAADALLHCNIENLETIVKVEKSIFGGKKVYFNINGDWVEREVIKQNDTYIWVRSDYGFTAPDTKNDCVQTRCDYDFQIELIEQSRKSGKYVYIHRIADRICKRLDVLGSCNNYSRGDRLKGEGIRCKVVQPFQ